MCNPYGGGFGLATCILIVMLWCTTSIMLFGFARFGNPRNCFRCMELLEAGVALSRTWHMWMSGVSIFVWFRCGLCMRWMYGIPLPGGYEAYLKDAHPEFYVRGRNGRK